MLLNEHWIVPGLEDPKAVGIALSALDAVQLIGMPEADVIIAQAAVYLARAPKSREVISKPILFQTGFEKRHATHAFVTNAIFFLD